MKEYKYCVYCPSNNRTAVNIFKTKEEATNQISYFVRNGHTDIYMFEIGRTFKVKPLREFEFEEIK